jgi:hypothetical protein
MGTPIGQQSTISGKSEGGISKKGPVRGTDNKIKTSVYALANTIFFVEVIREKFKLPETPNFKLFRELQYSKQATINDNFLNTKALKSEDWKGPQYDKRHLYTRFAVHGFHYHICENKEYHEALDSCICSLCKERCTQYHLEDCTKRLLPITHYATLKH